MKVKKNLLLIAAVKAKNMRLHKWMWSLMGIGYETHSKFKDLVMKTDENGRNVLQLAVMYNKLEIIQWIWTKLDKEVFNARELQTFFKMSTKNGQNILHLAAEHCQDPKIHEWLWEVSSKSFGREILKELADQVDKDERNFFHLAAIFNTNAVFTQLYGLGKQHLGAVDMRKLLRKKELVYDENVFDIAKQHAKDKTIHAWLKTKRHKYF
jgi:hypothetical protein